mgnify:FL=1
MDTITLYVCVYVYVFVRIVCAYLGKTSEKGVKDSIEHGTSTQVEPMFR